MIDIKDDEWEDDDESDTHKKFKRQMKIYHFLIVLVCIGAVIFLGYTLNNYLDLNKFCSNSPDGIQTYKGKFLLCVDGSVKVLTDYSNYTKAICNATNYCVDSLIHCSGETLIDIVPLDGGVQFSDDWIDTREPEMRWGWCNGV